MSRPVTLLSEPAWCQPSVPAPVGRLNKRCDANAAVVGFRERRPVRERLRARSNSRRPDERFPNGIREPAFPLGHAGPPPASPRQRAPRSASPRPATLSKLRQPEVRDRRLPQTRAEQQSRRRRSCRRDAITGVPGGGGRNGACRARSRPGQSACRVRRGLGLSKRAGYRFHALGGVHPGARLTTGFGDIRISASSRSSGSRSSA
jgi:hypothetical protein